MNHYSGNILGQVLPSHMHCQLLVNLLEMYVYFKTELHHCHHYFGNTKTEVYLFHTLLEHGLNSASAKTFHNMLSSTGMSTLHEGSVTAAQVC